MEINELYQIYLAHSLICTDTRNIIKNSLFFALKGDHFNGNLFAAKAIEQGCSYALVDEDFGEKNKAIIKVENVLKTLQDLANHHRKQLKIPVIAITGSNGKTTSKELIYAVLSKKFATRATKGNLNNHIGVPLTLLSITKACEIAIVEMGANHQKEIEELCKITEPDFGLITNIGKAHLEGFGGIEGVKKGKKELYDFIKSINGTIFINSDDDVLMEISEGIKRINFGTKTGNFVMGKLEPAGKFLDFSWKKVGEYHLVKSQIVGNYNFYNMLAAAAIGCYFGVEEESITEALIGYTPDNNRSQAIQTEKNSLVMDAYNANPSSMEAAIRNFSNLNSPNKFFILGDMLELGNESLAEHKNIVDLTQKLKLKGIFIGNEFMKIKNDSILVFESGKEAKEYLTRENLHGNTILIKGSRGIKLEQMKEVL